MKNIKNVFTTRRSNRGLFLKLSVFALFGIMILLSGQTLAQTPTPTPGGTRCTPMINVTEEFPNPPGVGGGLASFTGPNAGIGSPGPGQVSVDHLGTNLAQIGTGLRTITFVSSTNGNEMLLLPFPYLGPPTWDAVTVNFTVINPNLGVDFTLRAASQFHSVLIRVRCGCTPAIVSIIDDPAFLPPGGGPPSFALTPTSGITAGPGSIIIDHLGTNIVPMGTGLQTITVMNGVPIGGGMFTVDNVTVTVPPFVPGTYEQVTVTYTITNPSLPVDFTLRASSLFHGVIIRVRCGVTTPNVPEEGNDSN